MDKKKLIKTGKKLHEAYKTAKRVQTAVKVAKTAHTAYKIAKNPAWQLGKRAVGFAVSPSAKMGVVQRIGRNAAIGGVKRMTLPARIAAKVGIAVGTRVHAAYKAHQAKKPGRHNNQYTKGRM